MSNLGFFNVFTLGKFLEPTLVVVHRADTVYTSKDNVQLHRKKDRYLIKVPITPFAFNM